MSKPVPTFDVPRDARTELADLRRYLKRGEGARDQEVQGFDPDDYEWAPNVQMAYVEIGAGSNGHLPSADVGIYEDFLRNDTQYPMLIRSVTSDSRIVSAAAPILMKIGSKKKGEPVRWWHSPSKAMPTAYIDNTKDPVNVYLNTDNPGVDDSRDSRFFKLWKPYRLVASEGVTIQYGIAEVRRRSANEWAIFSEMPYYYARSFCVVGVGVDSGLIYHFTNQVPQGRNHYDEFSFENRSREDIWLTHLVFGVGDFSGALDINASAIYSDVAWTFEPTNGPKMSKSQRNCIYGGSYYLKRSSSLYDQMRHTFDYLPGGALVLEPGEGLVSDIYCPTAAIGTSRFRLGWEGYVVRARKGEL